MREHEQGKAEKKKMYEEQLRAEIDKLTAHLQQPPHNKKPLATCHKCLNFAQSIDNLKYLIRRHS